MFIKQSAFFAMVGLSWTVAADSQAAAILKCTDASGKVMYSDPSGMSGASDCQLLKAGPAMRGARPANAASKKTDEPAVGPDDPSVPVMDLSSEAGTDFSPSSNIGKAGGATGAAGGGGGGGQGAGLRRQAGAAAEAKAGAKSTASRGGSLPSTAAAQPAAPTPAPAPQVVEPPPPSSAPVAQPASNEPSTPAPAPSIPTPEPVPAPEEVPVPQAVGGINVDTFGAVGDGVTDDSAAINKALQMISTGKTLVFTPGKTYLLRKNIKVNKRGLKLWGYNATLRFHLTDAEMHGAPGAAQESIQLLAPQTGIYGFTIVSNLKKRLIGHVNSYAIYLQSDQQEVIDNRIEYTSVGILAFKATNFVISRNYVYRTFADGIHVTNGSWNGIISHNTVRETGDDMIAVVSYGRGEPSVGNVLIEDNDVAGNYWGRGISVVGGRDITIRRNKIAETTHGAGVLVNSEDSYDTSDVENVLVEDNIISRVQTTTPLYNPLKTHFKTGHGAIDINGNGTRKITNVIARNNTIHDTYSAGLFLRGNSCGVGMSGNQLSAIRNQPIRIDIPASDACSWSCVDNKNNGAPVSNIKCGGVMPTVVGSSL